MFQKNMNTRTHTKLLLMDRRKEVLQIKELKDTCRTSNNKSKQDRLLAALKLLVNTTEPGQNLLPADGHSTEVTEDTDSQTDGKVGRKISTAAPVLR